MKTILFCIIVIFTFSAISFAQIDTTSLSFYPLNVGDYWEYEVITTDYSIFPFGYYQNYYSYEVIGDTVFPKNNRFKIIKRKKLRSTQSPKFINEKVDSTTCNAYRHDTYSNVEFLIDSLKSQMGDSCNGTRTHYSWGSTGTICTIIRPENILNRMTISKTFIEQHWHSPVEYKLSKGFGLTYLNYYYDFGTYTQQLLYARIDGVEYGTLVNSIPEKNDPVVNEFHLYQNYPNPFNPRTIIPFELPQKSNVEISIYDVTGRKLKTLVSGKFNRGLHNISWDGTNEAGKQISSGVYIYTLKAISMNNSFTQSAKMILLQ